MTYHTQNSNSSYSRKGGRFVKIKDNIEAPKGFHYMADGKLMNDANHIAANGYIQKVITGFTIDTRDIVGEEESRAFTVNGEVGSFFSLQVINNDDGSTYDFASKKFTTTTKQALRVELDRSYSGSIVFPGESQSFFTINLTADTVDNIKTVHQKTVEFRNYDGSLNLNKTIGSESNILQKIIQAPEAVSFRLSCVAPSQHRAGVTQTVLGSVSSSNRVFFDNTLKVNEGPSGNIRPGDLITGTGVVIANWQLLNAVNPDNDNVREIQLSYAQNISNDVVLTFTPAFNGVTPHFTDSNTGSDASDVAPGSSFITSFSVTVTAPSGRLLYILKTPTERDVCCVESIVIDGTKELPNEDTSSSALFHRFGVNDGDGVARLSSGMLLDPTRSANTFEGSFLSPYIQSETTQNIYNNGYNADVRSSTVKKVITEAVEVAGLPTAAWSNGENKSQKGNITLNKQQPIALDEDTVNIFAYGVEQISKMNAGMTFSLSNVVLTGDDVTLTTGAASTGTAITVTECAHAAAGVELSGANINPLLPNPTVTSKNKRSGAGILTVSSAQPIEDGQKLKVVGGHTQILITGSIDIKNFPVGTEEVRLMFDLERILKST